MEYAKAEPLDSAPPGGFTQPADRRAAIMDALQGVSLGEYDLRIIRWISDLDDPTARAITSLILRAREAGPCA
jgi:hypothetical protein